MKEGLKKGFLSSGFVIALYILFNYLSQPFWVLLIAIVLIGTTLGLLSYFAGENPVVKKVLWVTGFKV